MGCATSPIRACAGQPGHERRSAGTPRRAAARDVRKPQVVRRRTCAASTRAERPDDVGRRLAVERVEYRRVVRTLVVGHELSAGEALIFGNCDAAPSAVARRNPAHTIVGEHHARLVADVIDVRLAQHGRSRVETHQPPIERAAVVFKHAAQHITPEVAARLRIVTGLQGPAHEGIHRLRVVEDDQEIGLDAVGNRHRDVIEVGRLRLRRQRREAKRQSRQRGPDHGRKTLGRTAHGDLLNQ